MAAGGEKWSDEVDAAKVMIAFEYGCFSVANRGKDELDKQTEMKGRSRVQMAIAIACGTGSHLKGLSLTDWYVER